jgi:hypothetical protein
MLNHNYLKKGKSKEFCETEYYNKVFKNTNIQQYVRSNHFFADLAQFLSEK